MAEDAGARTLGGSHAEIGKNIRLIIASPVHLVRDGLAATLRRRADVTVVDVIDLDPHGIAKIAAVQPDVVLVDLGQTDPAAAARKITAVCLRARLVAFALDETDDRVFACAAAGFCGYAARESGADEIHRALVDAVEGRMHCAPHIAAAMFARLARLQRGLNPQGLLPALSSRESEILALVEQGRSNKEIARQLAISAATVKHHMHNILQKLQVRRRGQAVARLRGPHAA
ncbi:MAG: response regulator transcription factor [Alphaproteobacteria bacterium]|nr:response regulator transcription factor [Alphaproteobacteria bacterium]